MKLISLALLLVLAVAVSAQIGPETSHSFQNGNCDRNNNNCDWIVGHWKGFVTSRATSLRFFDLPDRDTPLINYPFATQFDDLWCTSRPYEIPYECTFGYSEEDDHLYQYCWFSGVAVSLCSETNTYTREDNGELDEFSTSGFSTPAFFMTNRILSLDSGISFENLETSSFTGCLPYDVASKDLIIGNLWDGFSSIGSCPSNNNNNDFGPSPVLPASCTEYLTTTTTQSTSTTTTTTTPSTTTTTTPTTTSTSTTTTTTTPTTTSTTTPTTTSTTTPTTSTTTSTTTTHTTTHPTNPDGEYGCSDIYDGIDAVYGFELARVRPASFPFDNIDDNNRRCDNNNNKCECVRSSSACNWLVGQWEGFLFAKGFNEYTGTDGDFLSDPPYPFPPTNDNVRCQWSETATPFQCSYYFNEESGSLNSHCWYDQVTGFANIAYDPFTTFAWEQWSEISSLNGGLNVHASSADFLSADECIPLDRLDRDTFIQQFPDGFSTNPSCSSSPSSVFQCVDGFVAATGNNNMFTLNYRIMDATWHDWDASSSLSPLIALSLLLAALLAFF